MNNFKTTIKSNWKAILGVSVLIVGLGITVYLVQNKQIFKSRAATEINSALNVTDENGTALIYKGNNTYQATSKKVRIEISNLDQLK